MALGQPKKKKCRYCGAEFQDWVGQTAYCSPKCKVGARNAKERERKGRLGEQVERDALRELEALLGPPQGRPAPAKSLDEVLREARACGMTYGQYVARRAMEEGRLG